ncbi:MAG: hypothetical protein P1V51_00900 [Deltaproteobacteria bacterium]|nr:hypothetical protein [Deltaproteobacteria bacterium]
MVTYLSALAITLVSELSLLALAAWLLRQPVRRVLLTHLLTNLVTHPGLWLLFPRLDGDPGTRLWAMEVGVTLIEAAALATAGRVRSRLLALGLAVAVNLVSWVLGVYLL